MYTDATFQKLKSISELIVLNMKPKNSSNIVWRYAALERGVRVLIESQCRPVCSNCLSSCCCRADICKETFNSTLLKKLHGEKESSHQFSDRYGWLTERGCGLALGRPPVCYEFFCEDVLTRQPSDTHRYVLKTLGQLISHSGENALGEKHLIDIRSDEELETVDIEHICEQINEARSALEHIQYFYENGELEHDGLEQLSKIRLPTAPLRN